MHAVDGGSLAEASDPKDDANFLLHQKADDGNGKLDRGMAPHLGVPANFTDWHWAAQLNQARAVSYAIDHYRRWWPRTRRDRGSSTTAGPSLWAATTPRQPKPLWYAMRRAFALGTWSL